MNKRRCIDGQWGHHDAEGNFVPDDTGGPESPFTVEQADDHNHGDVGTPDDDPEG